MENIGPNVKKLIAIRMSTLAIKNGTPEPFKEGLLFLMDKHRFKQVSTEAVQWVKDAIAVVKTAPDNPYGDDDEAIAGEVLRLYEERKNKK